MPSYYKPKSEFEIVKQEKIKKYIEHCYYQDLKILLILAWLTGARLSEMLELKKKDFIFDNNEMKILIKTYKQKNHPIRELILSYSDPFVNEIVNYVNSFENNNDLLFLKCKRTYQKKLLKINKELYGDDIDQYITFHYLRHSLISYLARELRASGWEIQSWTGHKSSAYEEYIIKTATDKFKGKLGLRR